LLLVLIITIPRWAQTLAQVDKFTILDIPITAIGEGIVLEIGCYLLIVAHSNAYEEKQRYDAAWEAHDKAMQEQGKQNRKPRTDPELAGYGQLMVLYYALLGLTVLSQWPFLMGALSGRAVTELLHPWAQWGYTLLLVVAPEIVTFALARAAHFGRICARRRQERDKAGQSAQERRDVWALLRAQVGNLAQLRAQWRAMLGATGHAEDSPPEAPKPADNPPKPAGDLSTDARRSALLKVVARKPGLEPAQVAAQYAPQFGVSRRTIGRDLEYLERAGRIRSNGHGVEVLSVDRQ